MWCHFYILNLMSIKIITICPEKHFSMLTPSNSRGWAYESTLCALSGTLRCSTILKYLGMNSLEDIGGWHRRRNIRIPASTDQALRAARLKGRPRAWLLPGHHPKYPHGTFSGKSMTTPYPNDPNGVFCSKEGISRDAQNKKWGILF